MKYDYREAVYDAVGEYFGDVNYLDYETVEEMRDSLYDEMFISDTVTGNASGSYFCNAWEAEECLAHNLDLAVEALEEFGYNELTVDKLDAEYLDVTIRCYLLGEMLDEYIEAEGKSDFMKAHEAEEEARWEEEQMERWEDDIAFRIDSAYENARDERLLSLEKL